MCRTTPDDLAYGLKLALADPKLAPETHQRLQHLIDRWEAQQHRPDQDAAAHFLSIWESDQRYALLILSQIGARGCQALAQAVAAHTGLSVGEIFAAWHAAMEDARENGADHSTHPTISYRA